MAKTYHITQRKSDGKWQVKFTGAGKPTKLFKTQVEAIEYSKTISTKQDANMIIHKKTGKIRKTKYPSKKTTG